MHSRASTARSREFGAGLRAAIAEAGFTGCGIAECLGWDPSKISNLMHGKIGAGEAEVAHLLGFCRVAPAERDRLLALYPDMHLEGWWQQNATCAPARTLAEHLAIAKKLVCWQTQMVPDFLQTPAYTRAVIAASANVPADEVDARLQAQLELRSGSRQAGLKSTYYIHEPALCLPVGGSDDHRDQIHHLLRMAVLLDTEIRIVPAAIGAHAGLRGSFTQLTFDKHESLVYMEKENSILIVEGRTVQDYERVVRSLDESSMDAEASKASIARYGEELSVEGFAQQADS